MVQVAFGSKKVGVVSILRNRTKVGIEAADNDEVIVNALSDEVVQVWFQGSKVMEVATVSQIIGDSPGIIGGPAKGRLGFYF